jgi:tetratricopeptide (TPR) repeat protein
MSQSFINKFLSFFIVLAFIKFVLLLISVSRIGVSELLKSVSILIFFFVVLGVLLIFLKDSVAKSGFSQGNSSVLLEESLFDRLRKKYESLAEQYRGEGEYLKASNIHLKLLQNPYRAASVLEEGGLYNEAAVLYLKKLSNKQSAAQCYKKGKNYKKAIELYSDLGNKEKAGDLYMLLNDRSAAFNCYTSLITDYTGALQFVKASLVARHKMQDAEKAKELLLRGWNTNIDAFNCINNYFASFPHHDELKKAIGHIYTGTPELQKETLLTALKYEFNKGKEMEETARDIAYEIIASYIQKKPAIASEMKHFNPSDKIIIKDIIRYKASVNRITANYVSGIKKEK